jgi:hypothetical protein
MLLAVTYTTLLVVGSFCNFPGKRLLMMPYVKAVEMIGKMLEQKGR